MTTDTSSNTSVYESREQVRDLWNEARHEQQPLIAIRNGERGFVVQYDLTPIQDELQSGELSELRRSIVKDIRVPLSSSEPTSQPDRLGGEVGPLFGALHAQTEENAREIAQYVADFLQTR